MNSDGIISLKKPVLVALVATFLGLGLCTRSWAQSDRKPIRWNDALDQQPAWYASAEAVRIADNVLIYQHEMGGWPKNIDMARVLGAADKDVIRREKAEQAPTPYDATIDNSATYTQMRYLARVYDRTKHERFKESFQRGVDYLLEAQYENGGWPQYYPFREGYYEEITLNDDAMVGVLRLLRDIAAGSTPFSFVDAAWRSASDAAVERGIESILRMQIRQGGELTAWCAQHDKNTLEPAWGRTYEPPSLSGGETVGIIRFLMSIEEPSPEVIAAVEGAVAWLRSVEIQGLRLERFIDEDGQEDGRVVPDQDAPPLWARFYELGSNRPIFLGRDSVVRYSLTEIERERRGGYAYYGRWAADLLEKEYPQWKSKYTFSEDEVLGSNRHRVIISADFPPLDVIPGGAGQGPPEKRSDPDDVQSMVRFLLYTNDFDVEGLIASSATFANVANKKNILDILDLYDQVDENLRRRDPQYPTADYLRSVTWGGSSGNWGKPADEVLGEGKDSEASEAIIKIVGQSDSRPVWVCVWGGPQEVAQAIWKVQQTRSAAETEHFLSKLRIYMIGLGDKTGQDGSGQWMLDNFPNLFVIVSQKTYGGMFAQKSPIGNLEWLNANIREGHGPLGAVYPQSGFYPDNPGMQEGDTPSFLYLVSAVRGMNDPEKPDQESWGGQYEQRDASKNHWYDGPGATSVSRWLPEIQADFARRADWMLP